MKRADVELLVGACADAVHARLKAANAMNAAAALDIRVEALESLVEVMTDALLSGTCADPTPAPTKKAKTK